MHDNYKTPRIDVQNTITFTCSDDAIEPLLKLFNQLHSLGEMGCSRTLPIDWDGDGRDRLSNIAVNGMSLSEWDSEWHRLATIRKHSQEIEQEPDNETE